MTHESSDLNRFVTLEITVPREATEGMAALRGMVTALGYTTRQRSTLPGDLASTGLPDLWRIGDEQFLETSRELWRSEDYGASAISQMSHERRRGSGILWNNGLVNMRGGEEFAGTEIGGVPIIPLWVNGEYNSIRPPHNLTDEAMVNRAQFLWDHLRTPFTMVTTFSDHGRGERVIDLSAGDITRERLADYTRSRKYDQHSLHGTIGKMLDVIGVTAGVVGKNDIGERDTSCEFVEAQDLEGMMQDAGLTTRAKNDIHNRLSRAIHGHLETGEAYEHGEIILEGKLDGWQYARIATSSLAALTSSFKSKKEIPATRFLKQFA